ncbi:hypothetical protein COU88_01915 [Candidatus Roizmanbacteria bacterium CG10_big_fil_rev_8_21_14_0_10_39_6]|uniref:Uncharacterized protein n=1 Tax=Candidatus Roizmanbacteria bacterium CG10_big_fil_rev_8_21_14_0_10_39_6 TaxID=1974853 RepID=A0A2M8KSU1_9BACT|nr:MAG: hypothetical protein COU88_01915 [Candidatus Roizmanbacteria bacterium CG10_big_fil_rev_8_21_14_0_10_39_6]
MYFTFKNKTFDEKDMFIMLLGLFLIVSYLLHIPMKPFRFSSFVVVFTMLTLARITNVYVQSLTLMVFLISAILLSLVFSPYTLAAYMGVMLVILRVFKKI